MTKTVLCTLVPPEQAETCDRIGPTSPGRSRRRPGPCLAGAARAGLSVVELLVYIVLFVFVTGFVLQLIWGGRKADAGRKRLGVFQDLRISSQRISQKLAHATRLLFPPPDGKPYHQIVFLSEQGELHVIYLNDEEKLYLLNYDGLKRRKEEPILLARRTMEFVAARPPGTEDYVQFLARVLDDQNLEFALTDGILIRNLIR